MSETNLDIENLAEYSMQDAQDIAQKTETIRPEPTEFHKSLANAYEQFVNDEFESGKKHIGIYIPENYAGDWGSVSAEDYYMHLLSVIGDIPKQGKTISAEFIRDSLAEYKELLMSRENVIKAIEQAHTDFDNYSAQFGIIAGVFDPNKIIFVSEARLAQLIPKSYDSETGAITLNAHYSFGTEILLPIENAELEEPNSAYDMIAHELVHRVRANEALDIKAIDWLVEGMAQSHTEKLQEINNRKSERVGSIYPVETLFTKALTKKLGRESLVGMSMQEIVAETNSRFGAIAGNGKNETYFEALTQKVDELELFFEEMMEQLNSIEVEDMDEEEASRRERAMSREVKSKMRAALAEFDMDESLIS